MTVSIRLLRWCVIVLLPLAMVAEGRAYLREAWWVSTSPGAATFLSVMGFNLLGDGLRDTFDPRLH